MLVTKGASETTHMGTLVRDGSPTIGAYDEPAFARKYAEKRAAGPFWERECGKFIDLVRGSGKIILDAGCGTGTEVKHFMDKGFEVVGVDASEGMLAEARLRVPGGTFINMDMRDMSFEDGSFSGVWCCASLLHLPKADAPAAVGEFRRVIKDDGTLFVALKKGDSEGMVRSGDGYDRFFAYYRKEEAEKLLIDRGFAVREGYEFEKFGETWLCIFAEPG